MSIPGNQPRLLDLHFSAFLGGRCGLDAEKSAVFRKLVQELSLAMESGHSCLRVSEADAALLLKSPLVSAGESATPLVLVEDRLYLHRYYSYESRLAARLMQLARVEHSFTGVEALLDEWFTVDRQETDWQRRAAEVALKKSLCIISGGPGTGKTTTVVKIIGLLLQVLGSELRVGLAAPTGKAAMRLQESIGNSLASLSIPAEVAAHIPQEASTLHRLLGVRRDSPRFRHDADNPLDYDVVVVDEASMVDLAMMNKVVDALRPDSRLILLGDKDQLASVESGAVLLDCIRSLPDNTVELKKSYRFDEGIRSLAMAINAGDGEAAWSLLTGGEYDNVSILRNSYFHSIGERYSAYMAIAHKVEKVGIRKVFAAFAGFQVLCGSRHGARGVQGINALVENHLKKGGYDITGSPWYTGRPVMITANDYNLGLFNGDIGICLPDPVDGVIKVWFEQGDGGLRSCIPYRIPQCETVYAMTIHKSQGSEFDTVMVILPEEENRLLNRQLIYTGVTRAKEFVQVVASKKILVYALQSDYPRYSGLSQILLSQGMNTGY